MPLARAVGERHLRRPWTLRQRLEREGYLFITPAYVVIAAVMIFPIIYSVWMSLNRVRLFGTSLLYHFVGLGNFRILIHAGVFWHSVIFTVSYAIITVFVELFIGILLAVGVNHSIKRGRTVLLVMMIIPWTLVYAVSAQMWSYMFNGIYGIINFFFVSLGIVTQPVDWLGGPLLATLSIMVADVWKTTPFVAIILYAGLQKIPLELYEAAAIDGAAGMIRFVRITFPLLRGSIAIAALFRVLQASGLFDLPFIMTAGGPGTSTESIAMLSWTTMFRDFQFGPGVSIAVFTIVVVVLVCVAFLALFRAQIGGHSE